MGPFKGLFLQKGNAPSWTHGMARCGDLLAENGDLLALLRSEIEKITKEMNPQGTPITINVVVIGNINYAKAGGGNAMVLTDNATGQNH